MKRAIPYQEFKCHVAYQHQPHQTLSMMRDPHRSDLLRCRNWVRFAEMIAMEVG
jgi:hypothetical protein